MNFTKKLLLVILSICALTQISEAQLRKTAAVQKVGTFAGATLFKTEIEDIEIYQLSLPTVNSYNERVVLILGTKNEMLSNLSDLSTALQTSKRGDMFEYKCAGQNYKLYFRQGGGSKWFDVYEEYDNIATGRLFDRILYRLLKHYDLK